jgi:phage shock protein A
MSVFTRLAQLVGADASQALAGADDPEAALRGLLADLRRGITEVEAGVAGALATLRPLEEELASERRAAEDWGRKAATALVRASQADGPGAARFEALAEEAVRRQLAAEQRRDDLARQATHHREAVDTLREGLARLRGKHDELSRRRSELLARSRMADAQLRMNDVLGTDTGAGDAELAAFAERVLRQEAQVAAWRELDGIGAAPASPGGPVPSEPAEDAVRQRLAALRAAPGT